MAKLFTKIYSIYCDGAISNNGRKYADREIVGGTGWVILQNGETIAEGYTSYPNITDQEEPTNNRMELLSFIEAYTYLRDNQIIFPQEKSSDEIEVFSDSAYFINSVNDYLPRWEKNGWKNNTGKQIANFDLWQRINKIKDDMKKCFRRKHANFFHVKGHADNAIQNHADELAVKAKTSKESHIENFLAQ